MNKKVVKVNVEFFKDLESTVNLSLLESFQQRQYPIHVKWLPRSASCIPQFYERLDIKKWSV